MFMLTAVLLCNAAVAEEPAKDWKQCNTKLVITNTTDQAMTYNLVWLDHTIPEFEGRPVPRCGGGVAPDQIHEMSETFRLCLGRHAIMWYSGFNSDKPVKKLIRFTVTPNIEKIVITPNQVFMKEDLFYKPPCMEDA